MGVLAYFFGHNWILYTTIFFAVATVISLLLIRPQEINNAMARELAEVTSQDQSAAEPIPVWKFLKSSPVIIFILSVILFHLSNAAQLPMVGELLAKKNPHLDALFMALSIILGQFVMLIVAYSLGFFMNHYGRKPIFLVAFLVLPVRAMLYTMTQNPYLLLSIQLLDGIGIGIFRVIALVIISDLAKNTGRFNFAHGLVALCAAIGSSLSNVLAGFVVKYEGFNGSFTMLAIIALIGFLFYGLLMPETKNMENSVLSTKKFLSKYKK
jgi:MFS family permease